MSVTDATARAELESSSEPSAGQPAATSRYDRSIVDGPLRSRRLEDRLADDADEHHRRAQGIVDHVLVGHLVGYKAMPRSASPGRSSSSSSSSSSSLFTGMSVLVARFAGAGEEDKVDRTVYQAFLTAIGISLLVMAPLGYFAVAVPARFRERRAGGEGGGAAVPADHVPLQQRHAGLLHARRRAALGRRRANADGARHRDDGAEHRVQRHADSRAGPIPAFGTAGAAMGTCTRSALVAVYALVKLWQRRLGRLLPATAGASARTGRSSGRCSASACRRAFRGSR